MPKSEVITVLLNRMSAGDENAPEKLLPLVYEDLRRLAHVYLSKERSDHTLQATALVHEAYLRLVDWENASWQNRAHFFSVAASVMRNILVDHARRKRAESRCRAVVHHSIVSLPKAVSSPVAAGIGSVKLKTKSVNLNAPAHLNLICLKFISLCFIISPY